MAIRYVGNEPVLRTLSSGSGATIITLLNPSPIRGMLKRVELYEQVASVVKIKVFRDDGVNYIFIGETPSLSVAVGLNNLPCWIPVEKGDFLGCYVASGTYPDTDTQTGGEVYQGGDITTTTAKSLWIPNDLRRSFRGHVFTRVGVL